MELEAKAMYLLYDLYCCLCSIVVEVFVEVGQTAVRTGSFDCTCFVAVVVGDAVDCHLGMDEISGCCYDNYLKQTGLTMIQ